MPEPLAAKLRPKTLFSSLCSLPVLASQLAKIYE
jgi:hypothetical protein